MNGKPEDHSYTLAQQLADWKRHQRSHHEQKDDDDGEPNPRARLPIGRGLDVGDLQMIALELRFDQLGDLRLERAVVLLGHHVDLARLAHLADDPIEVGLVHIHHRRIHHHVRDTDYSQRRLLPEDLEHDVVAHPDVRFLLEHFGVDDDCLRSLRQQPAASADVRVERDGFGGQGDDVDTVTLTLVRAETASGVVVPALHAHHTRHAQHRVERLNWVATMHGNDDVGVEIGEDLFEREVERLAHAQNRHEDRAGQGQRDQCQRQASLAPEGVAQREQHRARQEAHTFEQPIDPATAEAPLTETIATDRFTHGDARTAQNRHQRSQQRDEQAGGDLQGEHAGWEADAGDVEVKHAGEIAGDRP